jgi:lysophospholipid acyltransferase (LPLAT)-like uncharacterized protein
MVVSGGCSGLAVGAMGEAGRLYAGGLPQHRHDRQKDRMKLSHPIAIKLAALLSSWIIRLWMGSQDYWFWVDDPDGIPSRRRKPGIYLFWHEMMFFPAYTHARAGFTVLVSRHRDGQLIGHIFRMLGGRAIQGSTTSGGPVAVRQMLRSARVQHLAVAPDGPRGPRRQVQMGAIYVASRSGLPLVPIGFAFERCFRMANWDRTALPRLCRPARCVIGEPISVPADLDRGGLLTRRLEVQIAMEDVQARAEQLAADGRTGPPLLSLTQILRRE